MNCLKKILLLLLALPGGVRADLLDVLNPKKSDVSLEVIINDEKAAELELHTNEVTTLEAQEAAFWEKHTAQIDKIKGLIAEIETALQRPQSQRNFLNKKLLVLKSIKQVVSNVKSTWREIVNGEKRHVTLLEHYVKDPEFSAFQLEKKSFNSFADLQQLNEQIGATEEKISTTKAEKNEIQLDLANRKKKEASSETAYKTRLKEQADFSQGRYQRGSTTDHFDTRQRGELIDLQAILAHYEKELAWLRVKEKEIDLATAISHLEIENKKLEVLKKKRDLMSRMLLRVDEKDVIAARKHAADKKQEYLNQTDLLSQKIELNVEAVDREKEVLKGLFEAHANVFEDKSMLTEWTTRPTTVEGYRALLQVGQKFEEIGLLEREVDLLHAQAELEKIQFEQEELGASIVDSWYKIKHQLLKSNEEFTHEVKQYESLEAELERDRVVFEDKRNTAMGRLNMQNKALASLNDLETKLKGARANLFRNNEEQYMADSQLLEKAKQSITKQAEQTGKLIEVYSKTLSSMSRSRRQANSMAAELQRVNLWQRSGRAISWEGLSNALPDLRAFFSDVKMLGVSQLHSFSVRSFWKSLLSIVTVPFKLFIALFYLMGFIALYVFVLRLLPRLIKGFAGVSQEVPGVYIGSMAVSMTLEFLLLHFTSFFCWAVLFFYFGFAHSSEISSIFFYLLSIFYLLYLAGLFVRYIGQFNQRHDQIYFSEGFQHRFLNFLYWLFASTISIFFFREAFILATYTKSELPDILIAFYSIIVRILLLSLIRKEDLLTIIPSKGFIWTTLWEFINNYYYPVLCCFVVLMILMDPHIGGYNNLVYYMVRGIIGTALIIRGSIELYVLARRSSSLLFFTSDGETLRERFSSSKALYGITVILLFVVCSIGAVLIIAWVWGKGISFKAVSHFFLDSRFTIRETLGAGGELQKVSIFDLIKTAALVPLGILIGFGIDRFVVFRIFSVLLVNPGVYNAISTITYYIVVISVITIGLWNQGFGFVIAFYITPILIGIVWAMRDIFNDFVAYFVILIQRPLKVGDYVKLDEETCGVVRSITPRAVVLRRKRGFCIIIPNSRIIRDTVTNWDYNLNYIVCPDVTLAVPFRFDPERVKQILMDAACQTPNVLKTPRPIVRLDAFEENGYAFLVRVFTSPENTLLQWDIASDVRLTVVKMLRQQSVEVACPVRVIRTSQDQVPPIGTT